MNCRCFLKVFESLQYLGRQGLALRGDEGDYESNFIQLLKLQSRDFPELKEWIEKNKYHDIQNGILMLVAHWKLLKIILRKPEISGINPGI